MLTAHPAGISRFSCVSCLPAGPRSWVGAGHRLPRHCHAPGQESGHTHQVAKTGAVTLIQRFGSALNLNVHFHMLFLDGVMSSNPTAQRVSAGSRRRPAQSSPS
ncbi:transposase [Escherichia coli]|nr:transposase [Escherichia coli]